MAGERAEYSQGEHGEYSTIPLHDDIDEDSRKSFATSLVNMNHPILTLIADDSVMAGMLSTVYNSRG